MLELLITKIMPYIIPLIIITGIYLISLISETILGIITAIVHKEKFSWFKFFDFSAKLIGGLIFILIGLGISILFSWQWGILLGAAYPLIIEYKGIDKNLKKLGFPSIISTLNKVYNFALDIKNKKNELSK